MMKRFNWTVACCCAGMLLCACESAPKAAAPGSGPPTPTGGDPAPTEPAVVMEAVTTFPSNAAVTASSAEMVFHIQTEHKQARNYWTMLGPHNGTPSRGELMNVEQTITDGAADETYLAPAWRVVGGYARLFGWFPIATSDQVIAGGIGTSFIIQRIEQSSGGPTIRVFLVNKLGDEAVKVRVTDSDPVQEVVVEVEDKFAEYAAGALSLKDLQEGSAEEAFVNWVESRAAAVGLP